MEEATQNRFNRFLGGFPNRIGTGETHSLTVTDWSPKVDISQDNHEYLLKADLPEMKKDDVRVTVEDGILCGSGERKNDKEDQKRKFHRIERAYGNFRRSFTLPEDADSTKVTAEFRDGVLTCGDQFRALQEGKIDLGFVGLHEPIEERGLQFRRIASYETVVAVAKNNPLVEKKVIKLKELKPMFFIGMSETSYPGYRRWLTQTCQKVGFSPKVLQDADIERTLIQSVAAGLGVALLPDQVKKLPHDSVVFRELSPTVKTESCIAWKTDNPSVALKAYVTIVGDRGIRMR